MMQVESANFVIIVNYVSLDGWPALEAEAIKYFKIHM